MFGFLKLTNYLISPFYIISLIHTTQSLPEVLVVDCWLYFATLSWTIDHCRNNLEWSTPQLQLQLHHLKLNKTNTGEWRMREWWDCKLLEVRCRNDCCWWRLNLKLRCCGWVDCVVRERLGLVLVVTGAGSVISPSGPVSPLLSPPTDMNNSYHGCSSSGQEVERQETAEDDRRDF